MNTMTCKIRILATAMALGIAIMPGLGATETTLTESLEGGTLKQETATRSDLWESTSQTAESTTACIEEDEDSSEDGEQTDTSSDETNETEDSNETSTDTAEEEPSCIVDQKKEDLKEELDDLPEYSYCKRIDGRMACVGFNDYEYCDAYVFYGYFICVPLWRNL